MAKSTAERSAASLKKKKAAGAEDLRLTVYPGVLKALKILMDRHDQPVRDEAISTMLLNLAALPPEQSAPMFSPIRHVIRISENVAREFVNESRREIARNPGDEIVEPA